MRRGLHSWLLALGLSVAVCSQAQNMPDSADVALPDSVCAVSLLSADIEEDKEPSPLDKLLPASPQATELARYGEYPVSYATGVPDINIPIYTVRLGNFTLPVSLSYHASGIKVDEVASTVGLGWSLHAGGAITRQICGAPDLNNASNKYRDLNNFRQLVNDVHESNNGIEILNSLIGGNPDLQDDAQPYDTETDRYTYSFCGKSGVFRQSLHTEEYIPLSHSRMLIRSIGKKQNSSFEIVDTDGVAYQFGRQEATGAKNEEGNAQVTAWYLTQVNTPNGNIHIHYVGSEPFSLFRSTDVLATGLFGFALEEGGMDEHVSSRYSSWTSEFLYKTPVVSCIEWNGNKVVFSYANDREDVWKTRLTGIDVVNLEGDTIQHVSLLNDSYWGNKSINKRMMLHGLQLADGGQYAFTYNEQGENLPDYPVFKKDYSTAMGINPCSSDYWGYYNGRSDKCYIPKEAYSTMKSKVGYIYPVPHFTLNDFADRTPNYTATQTGIIKSIIYPTGGRTEFAFEGNNIGERLGGLRIKSISNYGFNNKLLDSRTYTYLRGHALADHPLETMVYQAWHTMDICRIGVTYGLADQNITCTGTPTLPTGYSAPCFYEEVRETFLNGDFTDYTYFTWPDYNLLCGHATSAQTPELTYATLNDFGTITPYLKEKKQGNKQGNILQTEQYDYEPLEVKMFCVGTKFKSLLWHTIINSHGLSYRIKYGLNSVHSGNVPSDSAIAHSTLCRLTAKKVNDLTTGVSTVETYSYDQGQNTNQPKQTAIVNSDGKQYVTEYVYAFELPDAFHQQMATNYYMYDKPVETHTYCNGKLLTSQVTDYAVHYSWLYPKRVKTSTLGGTYYEQYYFADYDRYGNLQKLITNTCDIDSIVWGYNGTCPIAHWHNGTLKMRYAWQPLAGVTAVTKANDYTLSCIYDSMGRLSSIADANGLLQSFVYHYAHALGASSDSTNFTGTATALKADASAQVLVYKYMDGLGRPVAELSNGSSESGKSIYRLWSYDEKGRKTVTWQPVVCTSMKQQTVDDVAALAQQTYADSKAYAVNSYDGMDRITFSEMAGEAWTGKGQQYRYTGNAANSVRLYQAPLDKLSLVNAGYYQPNTLQGKTVTDADGHTMTTFTDKLGRKVLERRHDGKQDNDTYYVYNDLGQLRYVLSPDYQKAGYKGKYAYEYRYDERGNVVKKLLPGCSYTQYWYDRGNRLTFLQDATLRERGNYRFMLYDKMGRLAVQGTCADCIRSSQPNTVVYAPGEGIGQTGYQAALPDNISKARLETVNYYDDYAFLDRYSSELGMVKSDFQLKRGNATGLQTGCLQTTNTGDRLLNVYWYDAKGRLTDSRSLYIGKRLTACHTDYTYTSKAARIENKEYDLGNGSKKLTVDYCQRNDYSAKTDRLLTSTLTVNGKSAVIRRLSYDDLGRIARVGRGTKGSTVDYRYNLHGWPTSVNSPHFTELLHYTDGVGTPCYNGNISSMLWRATGDEQLRGYKLAYDGLSRLTDADYGERETLDNHANRYNEKVLEYTGNGGIKRFQRRGLKDDGEYGKIDNLHVTYDGNQLKSVTDDALPVNRYSSFNFIDGANEAVEYAYNGVGALTMDKNRGISSIRYDNLNNPERIAFSDSSSIHYCYAADGTKLRTTYTTAPMGHKETIYYRGNVVYRNRQLDKLLFTGGYCSFDGSTPTFHYYTQDHLGNNRTVENESGTIEQVNHYYPFGGIFNDVGFDSELQPYRYNGKELDRMGGLNTYDYGARQYFSSLPTWDRMDPLCEDNYAVFSYAYVHNNQC